MPSATTDLARFLATTGPEPGARARHSKPTVMARFVRRKKSTAARPQPHPHPKHIPLPVYIPPTPPSTHSSTSIPTFPEPPSTFPTTPVTPAAIKDPECPHCAHCVPPSRKKPRRTSCPPAIQYTPTKKPSANLTSQEAKMLLTMIEKLQVQLSQEQASRRALEVAIRDNDTTNNKSSH